MSTSTPASPVPGHRKYPRALILSLAAVLLLALLLLWHHFQQRRSEREMAEKLAAIRAQGFPASSAEIDAWYPEPPAGQNAATLYLQAFQQMVPLPLNNPWFDSQSSSNIFNRTNPIPPQARIELTSLITSNQAALQLLHDGAKLTGARYPVNLSAGFNALLPHLSQIRDAGKLLSTEALHHAVNDQAQPAVDSLISGLRLGHSLSNEPIFISFLVQIATYTETVRSLENVLHRTSIPPVLLHPLVVELERAENSLNLTRALAGERCNGLGIFADPAQMLSVANSGAPPSPAEVFMASLYKASGLQDQNNQAYLHFMEASIQASQKPPGEMNAAFKKVEHDLEKQLTEHRWRVIFISMLLPALTKASDKKVECLARLRLARLALTLHTYQSEHAGQLPDSLTALPQDTIPLDPFDSKPLRYRRTETGFLLWSIGADMIDQGGKPRPKNYSKDDFDLVFTVERASP